MKIKQNPKIGIIQRFLDIIRHGLLLFGIRNRLAKLGLDINPYYWVQEEFTACQEPEIKGNKADYVFRYLDLDELKLITGHDVNFDRESMIEGVKKGQLCVGLEYSNEIAAFMFIEFNDFVFSNRTFKLKANEAYLLNMWTFHSYRSKNLAPYLRYQSYQLLKSKGINVKYSITQYFNKSSIIFKNKLNSKHLKLFMSIVFFKRYYLNFIIRDFK